MAFSCLFRHKIRDVSSIANLFQKSCAINCGSSSHILQSKVCVPLIDQNRGVRGKSVNILQLKPLNFDYSGDLKQLEPLDLSELQFKYKDIPEVKNLPPYVQKLFTLENASALERMEHRNAELLDTVSKMIGPGVSVEKQICYLTLKIRNLTPYIVKERRNKKHKDYLIKTIAKRKKMLRKLRLLDYDRFYWLLRFLNITYEEGNKYDYYKLGQRALEKKAAKKELVTEKRRKFKEVRAQIEKEQEKFYKEKEVVLKEINSDIKMYKLNKNKILDEFESAIIKRAKAGDKSKKKVSKMDIYKQQQKEKKKIQGKVFATTSEKERMLQIESKTRI